MTSLQLGENTPQSYMAKDISTVRGKELQPNDAIHHSWRPGIPSQVGRVRQLV